MKKLTVLLLILALTLTMLYGCGSAPAEDTAETAAEPTEAEAAEESATAEETGVEEQPAAVTFTDALDREVTVDSSERVAVMIGSFADIWCIAGGKDVLVAAPNDTWTSFDLGLSKNVLNIGAIKDPNVEILLSAEPDFIIASSNTQADIDLLDTFDAAGITVAYFDVQNFDDYLHMLDICTEITGNRENYEQYGAELAASIEETIARQDESHPTVLCIRATGSSVVVKGSQDYLLGEMLADLGCVNVADSDSGLLENLSMEAIMADDPDYIFVVMQGSDTAEAEKMLNESLLSNLAWNTLRAVTEDRCYVLDNTLYNLKPNARWAIAYENLADILYPAD